MLVAKAKVPMKFSFNGYDFQLKRKEKLLFADDVFDLLPPKIKGNFEKAHSVLPPIYRGENLNGKTLFVFAQAAIGDALCMTPALREIKRRYPEMKLWVAISGRARPVLEGLPYIDKLLPHPAPLKEVVKADYMVKAVEMVGKPQFNQLNMVEYFLWKFYLYFAEKETPDVVVDEKIVKELKPLFDKAKKVSGKEKILLFHYLASSVHRTLPPRLLKDIEDLIWNEYAPIICSLPEEDITVEVALDVYGIRAGNFSPYMKDVRYLIAAVSLCDAVITADTATVHIAAGLGKPTVLISGAIEPELRCKTYPTVIPLRPNYKPRVYNCPCGIHALDGPCPEAQNLKQFYSPCLESIPAKVIYFALKDAELLKAGVKQPERCPVCGKNFQKFSFVEAINSYEIFECPGCQVEFSIPLKGEEQNQYEIFTFCEKNESARTRAEVFLLKILQNLDFIQKKLLFIEGEEFLSEDFKTKVSGALIKKVKKEAELEKIKAEIGQQKFDLIISIHLIEKFTQVNEILDFLSSLVDTQGGLVFLSSSFKRFEFQAKGQQMYRWWSGEYPPRYFTRWKPFTYYHLLKKKGFKEVRIISEPLTAETLIQNVFIKHVDIFDRRGQYQATLPKNYTEIIVSDAFTPFYLNSEGLGNFYFVFAFKEFYPSINKFFSRMNRVMAAEFNWGRDD